MVIEMKRRDLVKAIGQTAGGLVLAWLLTGCKSPSSSNDPNAGYVASTYWTLKVEYERPNIRAAKYIDDIPQGYIRYNTPAPPVRWFFFMDKIDDFHFVEILSEPKFEDSQDHDYYRICIDDLARYDGIDYSTWTNGDIITLTVVETGFSLRLTNIVKNDMASEVGPNATMAIFHLLRDGTLTNADY